jgi:hypothetical protein
VFAGRGGGGAVTHGTQLNAIPLVCIVYHGVMSYRSTQRQVAGVSCCTEKYSRGCLYWVLVQSRGSHSREVPLAVAGGLQCIPAGSQSMLEVGSEGEGVHNTGSYTVCLYYSSTAKRHVHIDELRVNIQAASHGG